MSSIYYKNQKYTGPTLDLGSGSLTTDDKTIVGAINELDAEVEDALTQRWIYHPSTTTTTTDLPEGCYLIVADKVSSGTGDYHGLYLLGSHRLSSSIRTIAESQGVTLDYTYPTLTITTTINYMSVHIIPLPRA